MENRIYPLAFLFFITVSVAFPLPVSAETDEDKTLSPYFFIENGDAKTDHFPLKQTDVHVNITGVVADVVVTQTYANTGGRYINARYIFPASTRAAVHGMKMRIGEHSVRAQIKERQVAQKKFDTAKKEGKRASLLKQQRPNVFSMNVANIGPGSEVEIELHYTELLVPTDGTYQFVYPTVVGPRYANQSEGGSSETDQWIKNPYLPEGNRSPVKFNIDLTLSTGIALQEVVSTSHETRVSWESKSTARIKLAKFTPFGGNRDFILNYRLAGRAIESGLMLHAGEDENFFLLMAQPPQRVRPKDILHREYIFVVDISGSMSGFPLNISKKLIKDLIGNLRKSDTFNVILFEGGARVMAPTSLPATPKNITQAVHMIDEQVGGGGTELLSALKKALVLPRDEAYSRSVLVVTDGYISAEKDIFHFIRKNLHRTNFFAFGIGSSVNRYLIEGMAQAGQGEAFVVTDPMEARRTADRFRDYVQSPVLANIAVEYDGFNAYEIEPLTIPDLFASRPVIVFGKWRGKPEGTIRLSGRGGSGRFLQTLNVAESRTAESNRALRYLWARHRIGRLSDYNPMKDDGENKAEITSLGLTYNLLTAHTSFVAVDESVRNPKAQSRDVHQPLPLPLGVSNLAVGSMSLPESLPEPELYLLAILFGLIIIGKLPPLLGRLIEFGNSGSFRSF